MNIGGKSRIFILLVVFTAAAGLLADDHYQVVNGPKDFYYGHISYVDPTGTGPESIVIREGRERALAAVLNTPIAPGDIIRTSADRRCEIQFDTGTIVRLDYDTELKIETILARSLSSSKSLSNLVLNRGRMYVMYKEYAGNEMFQVLTPGTAVKLQHNTVASIAAGAAALTETQVTAGRAEVLFGPSEKKLLTRIVTKGKRLIVGKDNEPQLIPAFEGGAFAEWNEGLNSRFLDLHEGQTAIPKPIEKYPRAVQHFAQTYGNLFGEWLWDGMLGYVWRPSINDISTPGYSGTDYTRYGWQPGSGWRPYSYGQWTAANGQMFWVPQEPWGWVPYHLGIWHWNKKLGWLWIPGSAFAPAWAEWDFFYGNPYGNLGPGFIWLNGWTPISVYQWMAYSQRTNNDPAFRTWWEHRYIYAHMSPLNKPLPPGFSAGSAVTLPSPIPKDVLKKVSRAIENKDPRVLEEMRDPQNHSLLLARGDTTSPAADPIILTFGDAEKFGRLARLESSGGRPATDPQVAAAFAANFVRSPVENASGRQTIGNAPSNGSPVRDRSTVNVKAVQADRAVGRFRDWNPDLTVARELGVRIEYLSGRNEIFCPDLGFSSTDRVAGGQNVQRMMSSRMMEFLSTGTIRSGSSGFVGAVSSSSGSASSSSGSSASTASHDTTRSSGQSGDRSSGSGA